jgi:hypothetical protein
MLVASVLVVCVCVLLWARLTPFILIYTNFREPLPHLSFVNNKFTIVQFADLHFGESNKKDYNSIVGMRSILAAEDRVDLIVFSGDQISGDAIPDIDGHRIKWIESLSVVGEFNIPFLTLFGNHDDMPYGFNPTIAYQLMIYLLFSWICLSGLLFVIYLTFPCIKHAISRYIPQMALLLLVVVAGCFITGPSSRIRDYLHNVEANTYPSLSYSSPVDTDCKTCNFFLPLLVNGTVFFNILTLDSGGGWIPYGVHGSYHDWIANNPGGVVETDFIAFFHVPTPEFKDFYADRESIDCFGELNTEQNNENLNHVLVSLKSSLKHPKAKAVFVGHDHGNDWCCRTTNEWPSICYGKHTGFGGYGEWKRGARVIRLDLDNTGNVTIETWLRMVDGTTMSRGFI